MIWLVMAWRMSFWFGMTDSKVIVGWQRLNAMVSVVCGGAEKMR